MSLPEFHYIGQHLPRKEDYRLLTGQGRYVDDLDVSAYLRSRENDALDLMRYEGLKERDNIG